MEIYSDNHTAKAYMTFRFYAWKCLKGTGAVVAALGRRSDVEECEFRGRSAGNEAVGVDCPGRRGVVVGVDHLCSVIFFFTKSSSLSVSCFR